MGEGKQFIGASKVPFAESGGGISGRLEAFSNSDFFGVNAAIGGGAEYPAES